MKPALATTNSLPKQSRRHFLKTATAAGLALPFITSSWAAADSSDAKLRHACIGVGGMGFVDLETFLGYPRAQVVALCDVDAGSLKKAAELAPGARLYTDWRELLKKEGSKIDSVNIAVPDHMHFPIALRAIKAKKHVYCQKPLCHDVAEVRALTQAAAKAKVVTQLGTQHASGIGDRTAVQLIKAGAIGKVKRAILCSNRPGAIADYRLPGPRPAQGEPPPASLNWDLWVGTAPMRPYSPGIYHPTKWRAWQDFGTGWLGDIGCHIFDAVWKALDLKAPTSVVAEVQSSWQNAPERRADTWPQSDHVTWTFPANQWIDGNQLTLEWFDGEIFPPAELQALFVEDNYPAEAALFLGTEGALLLPHGKLPWLLPDDKFKNYPRPKLEPRNHYHHFIDACLDHSQTASHFGITGPMAEAILLGTVAIRVPGQKLEWDPVKLRIPNYREAEKFLRRTYRAGWKP